MTLRSVCPSCGTPFEKIDGAAQCLDCKPNRTYRPNHRYKGSARSRGYTTSWDRLSRQARRLQPFCGDCGSVHDLTADHSPEAWRRHDRGLPIRLQDVSVVCRRCNAERGAARGARARPDEDDALGRLLADEAGADEQ